MEDSRIIALYWKRNEQAIRETDKRYGRYLHTIAYHVLASDEDSDECVNDTHYKAWALMPPHRPPMLSAFLGRITRHLAMTFFQNHPLTF